MSYLLKKLIVLLHNAKKFFSNPKRLAFFALFLLAVAVSVLIYGDFALAADTGIASFAKNAVLNAISYVLLALASWFMKLAIWMLTFVIELGGYNGFIDSRAVEVGWTMVRDVANMMFVVILLVIAFGTILGIEQYEWKKLLVKFLLAAVLVNFSKVICGLIIDASQVVMITFINGVAATAGGNLINMFNLNQIQALASNTDPNADNVFMASVGAIVFTSMSMAVMAVYLIILLARMVVLWVLIVLSPLAFVLSVIPNTQKYAQNWWSEFGGHVIVGPVLAFFLWLSFVTLTANSTGGIHDHIFEYSAVPEAQKINPGLDIKTSGKINKESTGVTSAMAWDKMANFAIAIAMLVVGAKVAQQTGATGGSMMAGAINFGKKVAMIASGVAAGMWLAKGVKGVGDSIGGGIKHLTKKGLKGAAYYAPLVGGEKFATAARTQWEATKGWYYGKAMMPTEKAKEYEGQIREVNAALGETNKDERAKLEQKKKELKEDLAREEKPLEGQARVEKERELKNVNSRLGTETNEAKRKDLANKLEDIESKMENEHGGGVIGWLASRGISLEKRAEKTKRQAETRKKILWKRTGSKSGGWVFGMTQKGQVDAQDRMERGWLKAEEARSAAKDEEGENQGMHEVLSRARFKDGKFEHEKGSMQDRITQRKYEAEKWKAKIDHDETLAKLRLVLNPEFSPFKMPNIDGTKFNYKELEEVKTMTKFRKDWLTEAEKASSENMMAEKINSGDDLNSMALLLESGVFSSDKVRKDIEKKELELKRSGQSLSGETDMQDQINLRNTEVETDIQENEKNIEKKEKEIEMLTKAGKGNDNAEVKKANEELVGYRTAKENLKKDLKGTAVVSSEEQKQKRAVNIGATAKLLSDKRVLIDTLDIQLENKALDSKEREKLVKEKKKIEKEIEDIIDSVGEFYGNEGRTLLVDEFYQGLEKKRIAMQRLREEKEKISGGLGKLADRIRNGDKGVVDEVIKGIESEIATLAEEEKRAEPNSKEEKKIKDEIKRKKDSINLWKKAKNDIDNGGSTVWGYTKAKAQSNESARLYGFKHNKLLSDAEQVVIWNKRGINTPNAALDQLIENAENDFKFMPYEQFVANAGNAFLKYSRKLKSGEEITDADKAVLVGLFKRGFNESWIDDIIIGIMANKETREEVGKTMGWKDSRYTKDKIGDLQSFIATGGNADFASNNVVIREFLDQGARDNKSVSQVFDDMRNGKLDDYKAGVMKNLVKMKRTLTKSQRDLMDKLLDGEADAMDDRTSIVDEHIEKLRDNQATLQFFGNLRNDAIAKGHGENAGWALNHDVGNGEQLYVTSGVDMARDNVYLDMNKTEARVRAKAQTHMNADLATGDGYGQIIDRVRQEDHSLMRNGINTITNWNSTTGRYIRHMNGLSSEEDTSDFRTGENGSYKLGGSKSMQKLAYDRQRGRFKKMKASKPDASDEDIKEVMAANKVLEDIYLPQAMANMPDFLMTAGAAAGIQPMKALAGEMNFSIPYLNKEGKIKYNHIKSANQFVDYARKKFGVSLHYKEFTQAELDEFEKQLSDQDDQTDI
ncbi:MAG: hypothetical protein ABIH87_01070 [bacterium]